MQFNELKLTNFGAFRGAENVLHLTPPSCDRSVVLVGALNGSGKTTIIEAFQLALYGKRSKFGRRAKKSSYDDYLRSIRNRHASLKAPTSLELTFTVPEDGRSRQYRLKRSWLFDTAKPKEFFQVFVDGAIDADTVLSETWQDEVERFLPRRLANLFFFDGERVETLADPESSAEVLQTAISSLLGLDVVDRCRSDLQITSDRVNKEAADSEAQELLERLEGSIREIRGEIDQAKQAAASIVTNDIPQIKKQLDDAQSEFEAVGGNLFKERTNLEVRKTEAVTKQTAIQHNLISLAQGALPLRLVRSQLEALRDQDDQHKNMERSKTREVVIREFSDSLVSWLEKQNVSGDLRSSIEKFTATKVNDQDAKEFDQSKAVLTDSERQVLGHLLDSHFESVLDQALRQLKDFSLILSDLESLHTALSKVPDESHVASIMQKITKLESHFANAENDLEDRQSVIRRLEQELDRLHKERGACYDKILLVKEAERYTEYTKRSIETLTVFREKLLAQNIAKMEATVLEAFKLLMRKSSLVKELCIDPSTMEISLMDPEGQLVDTAQLSAGERQLLAISVLWGLAKSSKLDIPVVIDTPLGRLDGEHRKNMINTYFPQASHQVILLSTDTEVDQTAAELMEKSVGHKYVIEYCEKRTGSYIEKGYFGEAKQG